MGNHWEYN